MSPARARARRRRRPFARRRREDGGVGQDEDDVRAAGRGHGAAAGTRAQPRAGASRPERSTRSHTREVIELASEGTLLAEPETLIDKTRPKIGGYPANFHVRDFLAAVRTRGQTRANADVACWSHITCHAANIALFLGRRVKFDPKKREFIGDEEANRLRSEAMREPWRT